jgi:hypothetical protein
MHIVVDQNLKPINIILDSKRKKGTLNANIQNGSKSKP